MTAELGEKSMSGAMFFGDNLHINVPGMVNKVRVWRDADGNLHKEKLKYIQEKDMKKKEMLKHKEEIKKLKKLKEKELQEKLKVIEEEEKEKEEEIFI